MNLFSIIIACHNDKDIINTCNSIWDTLPSPDEAEIIIVDDCSNRPVESYFGAVPENKKRRLKIIRNAVRCGCGPSRHIGVQAAALNSMILIIDPHMRFNMYWYENARMCFFGNRSAIYCAKCIGLDKDHMNVDTAPSWYQGANLTVVGPDRHNPSKMAVMEPQWNSTQVPYQGITEIGACMGACYFMQREWFLKINALRHLRIWGGDELMLSIKTYLCGGKVLFMPTTRIGHIFRDKSAVAFTASAGYPTWNKMFAILTLLPTRMQDKVLKALQDSVQSAEWDAACDILRRDYHIIATEAADNSRNFIVPFEEYADRFGIALPT